MTKFYVDGSGNYLGGFDGALPPSGAIEVTTPPEHAEFETWDGSQWIETVNKANVIAERSLVEEFESSKVRRLLFEINYDQENRLRVIEAKSSITKAVYRDALLTRLKAL